MSQAKQKQQQKQDQEQQPRHEYALVVAAGGGADAQVAYAVAKMLEEQAEANGQKMTCVYATCKGSKVPTTGAGHMYLDQIYSVESNDIPYAELNDLNEKGRPNWVGTCLYDGKIPQTEHDFEINGTKAVSPLLFALGPNQTTRRDLVDQIFVYRPEGGYSQIVVVDSGGDVLGSPFEDARDVMMLDVVHMLAQKHAMSDEKCNVCLWLTGLCTDGENYYFEMRRKLTKLKQCNRILGSRSGSAIMKYLEPVIEGMAPNRTPCIMRAALNDKYPMVDHEVEITDWIMKDGKAVVGPSGHVSVGEIIATGDGETGLPASSSFIELPERHHRQKNGDPMPPNRVPVEWAASIVLVNATEPLPAL